ncbi:unnamed protein product [Closterium sp. NIES-54]
MELLFNHYGLLQVMDGELKRPASEGATKEWDRRSKDGFFLLSQCLSSNHLHHIKHLIKDIQCGPKAWKILKDVYAPSSEVMVVVLERQLHAVKINEGDAVQGAFDQLRDLYVKLSAAGVDYPDIKGAATGAEPAGAGSGGTEPEGAEPGGAESRGADPGGAESECTEPGGAGSGGAELGGTEPGGAEPGGAGSARVASRGATSRRELLSPQELREWFARRWSSASKAAGPGGAAEAIGVGGTTAAAGSGGTCPGGAGAARPGGPTEAAEVGPPGGSVGASGGTGAAGSPGTGAAGTTGVGAGGPADAGTSAGAGVGASEAGGAAGAGAPAGSPGAVPAGSGGAARPRPYFVPLLEQVLGLPPSPGPAPPLECPQPVQSQSQLPHVSPLPAPSPYAGPTEGLAERRAPASCPASPACPACTSRRTSRPRPPPVLGTHQMTLRPSTAPLRVPLPSPPASSLPVVADPASDSRLAASPTLARFLATIVTDPSLASSSASALVAELVDFAACCRLDYAASLVAESVPVCPPSVRGECALSTDVLEDFQCFAAALPHLVSTLLALQGDPDAPDIPTP